jgi:hypothetical protein
VIVRLALFALLPACALAQLQTLVVVGATERALGTSYDAGSVAVNDTLTLRFRVRNMGSAAGTLRTVAVTGGGFSLDDYPPLPYTLAGGAAVDFTVRFTSATAGGYTGSVAVNGVTSTLKAAAVVAASVELERSDGTTTVLTSGSAVDFGSIERGTTAVRRIHLVNRAGGYLQIASVAVSGQAFSLGAALSLPVLLDSGQRLSFDVRFAPQAVGAFQGALTVDGRQFALKGTATEIPLPRPVLRIELDSAASARQGRVRIALAETARIAGAGELRVEFQSAVTGVTADPAIFFLPVSSRFVAFTVRQGDLSARFGDRDDMTFQTGTTAGTLLFTAKLGAYSEQARVIVAPEPVVFESVKTLRSGSQVELQIVGYDNVRSASRMTFTFYTAQGSVVAPGAITVDVSADFLRYFESSTVGGAFALRAIFPITGTPSEVVSMEATAANSVGETRTPRLQLP